MKKLTKNNKGFSLIELIIVIAIMAVLVAIIAPNLTKYLGKSKTSADDKNKDEIASTLKTCITDFEMDNGDLMAVSTTATISWANGAALTANPSGINAANSGNKEFWELVNAEIDNTKTKSKVDSSKYAQATISRAANGTYSITVAFV